MTTFAETMAQAITSYRQILKRHLSREERRKKLIQLHLQDPSIYSSDASLFKVAQEIIADIENNMHMPVEGYYSYYGITRFGEYLRNYLIHYTLDGSTVVHKEQKASQALVTAIQLMALPANELDGQVVETLKQCNETIAHFGLTEQHQLYNETLQAMCQRNKDFYHDILYDFKFKQNALNHHSREAA